MLTFLKIYISRCGQVAIMRVRKRKLFINIYMYAKMGDPIDAKSAHGNESLAYFLHCQIWFFLTYTL